MKSLSVIFLIVVAANSVMAQTANKSFFSMKDTATVDIRAKKTAIELLNVRDSIMLGMETVKLAEKNATEPTKGKLRQAHTDLKTYLDRANIDVKDVFAQLSPNAITDASLSRLRSDASTLRRSLQTTLKSSNLVISRKK